MNKQSAVGLDEILLSEQINPMNIWSTVNPATRIASGTAVDLFVPPVRVIGPKSSKSPLVFAFPHSGRNYPSKFLQQARLSAIDIRRSEDAYVDQLFPANELQTAQFISAIFPRSWVDANRHPQALDPDMFIGRIPSHSQQKSSHVLAGFGVIPKRVGQGLPIYRHKLKKQEILRRISSTHTPYHLAVEMALHQARAVFGFAILVDCHSMPSICATQTSANPIHIVLGDRHGTSCNPKISAALAKMFFEVGLQVAHNQPYAGGYSVTRHGQPEQNIHAIQIEIARNLYMDEESINKHDGFGRILSKIVTIMQELERFANQYADHH